MEVGKLAPERGEIEWGWKRNSLERFSAFRGRGVAIGQCSRGRRYRFGGRIGISL